MNLQRRKHLQMNLIFDIETDDLDATKIWCIVAKQVDGQVYKFGPNQIV